MPKANPEQSRPATPARPNASPMGINSVGAAPTVLVVDDNKLNRRVRRPRI